MMDFWAIEIFLRYFDQFCLQLIFLLIKNSIFEKAPISKNLTRSDYAH